LAILVVSLAGLGGAAAAQTSSPAAPEAGRLDVSGGGDASGHSCAVLAGGVRCWGFGGSGRLGYADTATVGDDETPGTVGAVSLGAGRSAVSISAGAFHTCAVLDDGSVRCWGFGANGRLGYQSSDSIGDDEAPASAGPVSLGGPAVAISAGGGHTCAILQGGSVRCWGFGADGRLGYGNQNTIGDNETPDSVGPVNLGAGRTATAISAGQSNVCALLDDSTVRCWGAASNGQLGLGNDPAGHGNEGAIGDNETPGEVETVDLGMNARAITAGDGHACALLDDGTVRCWGYGGNGRLGYASTATIGDNETPGTVGPVNIGANRRAVAISAGDSHTCALLDDANVRCWGYGAVGRLGYAGTADVGDDEVPGSVGPVNLGAGRTATAISAGGAHTCARLDDGTVRCWGTGAHGRLGYCNELSIGDDETPGAAGPVQLAVGSPGATCPAALTAPAPETLGTAVASDPLAPSPRGAAAPAAAPGADGRRAQAARARALRGCLATAARHPRSEERRGRHRSGRSRAWLMRHTRRHRSRARRVCRNRHGRIPGRVTSLAARPVARTRAVLEFDAAGTDGNRPPAAHSYVVKQSRRPIRRAREFRRARSLCRGSCRFPAATQVGGRVELTVVDLRPGTVYHYAIAARDNVSRRLGPRSATVRLRTG